MISPTDQIRAQALTLGFSHCGFARAEALESWRPFYEEFLAGRDFTGMNYLERFAEQRLHPELLLPGVQSVIALLMNYYPEERLPEEENFIVSTYAYGHSYRKVVQERLQQLISLLEELVPGSRSLGYADSGPVLEKQWAQRCGVGWIGKHSILVNPQEGSFFFIGIILTTIPLEPDPPAVDHCGNCTRCVDACPTNALHTPYRLDINRCLTYHSNINKGEIPEGIRGKFRERIYGCDSCQDACPYNRKAVPHREPAFNLLPGLAALRKPEWLSMPEEEFNRLFEHSEIGHMGFRRLRRNMELSEGQRESG